MTAEPAPPQSIPFKAYGTAVLLRGIILLLGCTYRLRFTQGEERFTGLVKRTDPVILCAWHNRIFFFSYLVERYLTRKGFPLTQLISLSRDGNIGYLLGKWAGVRVVRGSSNRGGSKGLRDLFRAIQKDRSSIVLLPDGSTGPIYEAKAGTIVLAQLSGAPLYPFSFTADRCWRVKSWDRLIIPKPFARISIQMAEPIQVPRELNKEELEEQRLYLQGVLNGMRD